MALIDSEYVGLNGQKIAAFYDTVTQTFYQKQILTDVNGTPIEAEDLGSGLGLLMSAVGKQEVTGVFVEGDDVTDALPVYVGAYACTSLVNGTPLVDQKMRALRSTADGRLLTLDKGNPEDQLSTVPVIAANDTGSHPLVEAQATGIKVALWGLELVNVHATASAVAVLKDGGTEVGRVFIPANSGVTKVWPAPIRGSVATAFNYALVAAIGANQIWMTPFAFKTKI